MVCWTGNAQTVAEVLLSVERLSKQFGGVVAADNLSLEMVAGEMHAVIGPNGAGKTTLISTLTGMLRPDRGIVRFDGMDITRLPAAARARLGLGRSFQVTSIFKDFSCLDNVALGVQARSGHSFRFWRPAREDRSLREPAQAVLDGLGLGPRADTLAGHLAHGEQRQLEIAMALATEPKVLLLDEPMAGMGAADSARMTEYLRSFKGKYTTMLVEHDMDVVFALADRVTVLVYGRVIASGTPTQIRANEMVRQAYLGISD